MFDYFGEEEEEKEEEVERDLIIEIIGPLEVERKRETERKGERSYVSSGAKLEKEKGERERERERGLSNKAIWRFPFQEEGKECPLL